MPSFNAAGETEREFLYTDYDGNNALGQGWAVRSSTHKYLAYDNGTEVLYDLIADPDETIDVSTTNSAIVAELRAFGLEIRGE